MRPRYIEIEGLQSFKEIQRVDFDILGENGIFGIFGPTGSGKSTILDAITLALYGNVQRALRGTQGIINIDSNEVRVCFTFDLLKDSERKTYRAERVYRRKKGAENSAESRVARLVEILRGSEKVLADRAGDVTGKVEELLGLRLDDFTRSVVLPQNKFQEFLFLEKAKKREMMERIFCLEEYGRQLTDRVLKKMYAVRDKLSNLQGAISALGELSEKSLIQAESKVKAAQKQKNKVEKELKQVEAEFNESREVWELFRELEAVDSRQNEHLAAREEMNSKRNLYENSVKAENMVELLTEYKEDEKNLTKALSQFEGIIQRIPVVEKGLNDARTEYDNIRMESDEQKPRLIQKKEKLNSALEISGELDSVVKELKFLNEKSTALKEQMESQNDCIGAKKDELLEQEEKLKEYKQQIKELKVDIDYRNEIQKGIKLEESLKNAENDKDKLKERFEELSGKIAGLEEKQKEVTEDRQKVQHDVDTLKARKEELEKLKPCERNEVIRDIEKKYCENAVHMLAKVLRKGEECPVCGSKDHPNPASDVQNMDIEAIGEEISYRADNNERLKALEQWEAEVKDISSRILEESNVLSERLSDEKAGKAELDAYRESLAQIEESLDKATYSYNFNMEQYSKFLKGHAINSAHQEMKRIEENERKSVESQKQLEKLEKQIKSVRDELDKLTEDRQELWNRLAGMEGDIRHLEAQKSEKEKKISALTGGMDAKSELKCIDEKIKLLDLYEKEAFERVKELETEYNELDIKKNTAGSQKDIYSSKLEAQALKVDKALRQKGFTSVEEAEECILSAEEREQLKNELEDYERVRGELESQKNVILKKLDGRELTGDEWRKVSERYNQKLAEKDDSISRYASAKNDYLNIKDKFETWVRLNKDHKEYSKKSEMMAQIQKLLKGNSFIEFISEERLRYIAREASETLGVLTKFRYALELDSENGFVIRDNANGGVNRPVTSLSGGEVFLTSLALALALSKQIQLKGQSPLEFFFLDEGFGTLDSGLLDTVIDSLGRLSSKDRVIGLISHVPELKNRMGKRLIVEQSTYTGRGSSVRIEKA